MKKAQGLSLNVIIIAAIVLIVLIVLWAIFTGRIGSFTSDVKECRGIESYDPCGEGYADVPGTKFPHCCIKLEGRENVKILPPEKV